MGPKQIILLTNVGVGPEYKKNPAHWPSKLRDAYVKELKKLKFSVMVVDNRHLTSNDP